jgi:SHS2 domain-containing protein
MDYEIIEDITLADIAIKVRGYSLEEIFIKGGNALVSLMAQDPSSIEKTEIIHGEITSHELEILYFDFLNEILYYKDAKRLILMPQSVEMTIDDDLFRCKYNLCGDKISQKYTFNIDIKAITLHGLKIYKEGDDSLLNLSLMYKN